MTDSHGYWFAAKRYGWGWGLPLRWQGWVVLAVFLALLALGTMVIAPHAHVALYVVYVSTLSALLVGICWLKGEPPRWRWGKDSTDT